MRLLFTLLIAGLMLSPGAFACFCSGGDGCPGLGNKAGPVFVGTVVTVTDLPRSADAKFLSTRRARIRVDEPFGGLPADTREVDILTGSGGGDCGIPFRPGDVYLIYASPQDDGLLHAGICSSTRKVDGASSAVRILRQRRDGQRLPSLVGRIAQADRNFKGLFGKDAPLPLPNAVVRVRSGDRLYETRADGDGLFALYDLPTGRYQFVPELPPGTALSRYLGSDDPPQPIDFVANSCTEHDLDVFPAGSIQGRVLDSSKPLPHAAVYIVPAGEGPLPKKSELYWESQSKSGFFKFVHLPPGRYLIFVNPDDSRDPAFPYPRTFYPGVHEQRLAGTVSVAAGEQVKDADIHLPPPLASRQLTVHVVWADGRLVKDYVFVHAKGTVHTDVLAHTRQPDPKVSIVNLTTLPGETYEVEAELVCQYSDARSLGPGARLKSNKVQLAPGDEQTQVTLTIPATACPEVAGKTLQTER